jgi:hypothetical protein
MVGLYLVAAADGPGFGWLPMFDAPAWVRAT